MSLGLTHRTIQQLGNIFAQYPQIEEAVVYGSRAMGNYRDGSDIDIVLKGSGIDFETLLKIRSQLDDSSLPYQVDISSMNDLQNPDLLEHIRTVGKTIFTRTGRSSATHRP